MRRIAVIALAALVLAAAGAARAIESVPYPESEHPAWLGANTIRFDSNIQGTNNYVPVPYVMAADGSSVRLATDAEAHQEPVAPPDGEQLAFDTGAGPAGPATLDATGTLYLVNHGTRRLVEASAYLEGGAALSPDGRAVVFAQWVGETYADSVVLYAVPADGSSEPRRLTPTSCTAPRGSPRPGGICFDGTDGPDRVVGTRYGDLIIGGSGNDTVRAGDGMNQLETQWGDDDIRSGSGVDVVFAGAGDDAIRTGAARDYVYPGPGRDRVYAGAGPDIVVANDGERDVIDCGLGDDRAVVDRVDTTFHCEHVTVRAPRPDPKP